MPGTVWVDRTHVGGEMSHSSGDGKTDAQRSKKVTCLVYCKLRHTGVKKKCRGGPTDWAFRGPQDKEEGAILGQCELGQGGEEAR